MLNPNYTFNYKYESGDRMHYRLDVLDESVDQPLGWLPSEAAMLMQALDSDNSYEGLLHRYRHRLAMATLQQDTARATHVGLERAVPSVRYTGGQPIPIHGLRRGEK